MTTPGEVDAVREYRDGLRRAGFTGISITATHQVTSGMHSAIIQAVRP